MLIYQSTLSVEKRNLGWLYRGNFQAVSGHYRAGNGHDREGADAVGNHSAGRRVIAAGRSRRVNRMIEAVSWIIVLVVVAYAAFVSTPAIEPVYAPGWPTGADPVPIDPPRS